MPQLKRPCPECPWQVNPPRFGFSHPTEVRLFISRALDGRHHQCHMNSRQFCVCKGSKIFAAKASGQVDPSLDMSVAVWTPDQLIETTYRLRREGRI
jgi:hypothetical protein